MSHYNEQQQERSLEEALGYWVIVRPFRGWQEIINRGFTSQRVGAHLLLIYPPPFYPQRQNEEEIAMERLQQVHVEVTEGLSVRRPVLGVLRSYRNTISRGNNLLAPERIPGARASRVHTIRRLSGGTEPTPTHLS